MKKIIVSICILGFVFGGHLFAGDPDRVGTTSAPELLIPVGARSIGMGGASLGDVTGAEAIYWNPGGMARAEGSEVLFNNMTYIADIDMNYLAASFNAGSNVGSFGFHIKSLNFGDIEQTTVDAPDGNGITYSPTYVITGLTYGRHLTDRISAGVTGKYIYESIMQAAGTALAIDLGVVYTFSNNLNVGVTMKNVGTKMQYNGRDLETTTTIPGADPGSDDGYFRVVASQSDIPSLFTFGVGYRANFNEENTLTINGGFSNFNDASDKIFGGAEYEFNDLFFLRGGYNYDAQSSDDSIFGASFGAGFNIPLSNFNLTIDYAFLQTTDYFDSSNIFTIKLAF